MDYSRNFLRVPRAARRLLRDGRNHIALVVYLELLDRVAYEAGERTIRGRSVHLEVGELVVGRRDLSDLLGLGEQQVRTALRVLEIESLIVTIESTHRGTRISLPGYAGISAQVIGDQPSKQPTAQPTAQPTGQPLSRSGRTRDTERESSSPSWAPNEEHRTRARAYALDVDAEERKYRAHHGDKSRAVTDAGFLLWLERGREYERRPAQQAPRELRVKNAAEMYGDDYEPPIPAAFRKR